MQLLRQSALELRAAWSRPAEGTFTSAGEPLGRGPGRLGPILFLQALGVLAIAVACNGARAAAPWTDALYWAGLALIACPPGVRLLGPEAGRRERLALLVATSLATYAVKVVSTPLWFSYYDEYSHWRSLSAILEHGRLFQFNALLPILQWFPGLHIVTTLFVFSGVGDPFTVGVAALGVVRVLWALALYLLYYEISGSVRVAALAGFIYMLNPNFVYFSSQFAYESLSLPLATLLLFICARQARVGVRGAGLGLAFVVVAMGVVVTHHLTTAATIAFLALAALVALAVGRGGPQPRRWGGALLAFTVLAGAWLLLVARATIGYVQPHFAGGAGELLELLQGGQARRLFVANTGATSPLHERVVGFASIILIAAVLPFGWLRIMTSYRRNVLAVTLAVAALAYPPAMALRLTSAGSETSNRSQEFLFVALALLLAVAFVELWERRPRALRGPRARRGAFGLWVAVVAAGSVIIGWSPWGRMPGPYMIVADQRSIEAQGVAAARWARDELGPGGRISTDRTNRLLMANYGLQRPVTNYADGFDMTPVHYAETIDPEVRRILRESCVRYLVIDRRLGDGLPQMPGYFEGDEPIARDPSGRRLPLSAAQLEKFDDAAGFSRIFDSGDLRIYAVGGGLVPPACAPAGK